VLYHGTGGNSMVGGCCIYHTVFRASIGNFLDQRLAIAYKNKIHFVAI
jgi:hypothetical protein